MNDRKSSKGFVSGFSSLEMMLRTLTVSASSQERKYDFYRSTHFSRLTIELDNASVLSQAQSKTESTKGPQIVASFYCYDGNGRRRQQKAAERAFKPALTVRSATTHVIERGDLVLDELLHPRPSSFHHIGRVRHESHSLFKT